MAPSAPGRFSTSTGCPIDWVSACPRMRAAASVAPPAGNWRTMRMGLDGYCAAAGTAASAAMTIAPATAITFLIMLPPGINFCPRLLDLLPRFMSERYRPVPKGRACGPKGERADRLERPILRVLPTAFASLRRFRRSVSGGVSVHLPDWAASRKPAAPPGLRPACDLQ